jgi:hypothetical protein
MSEEKVEVPHSALNDEYKAWVLEKRRAWLINNRPKTRDVWEVMDKIDREKVQKCLDDWGRYIGPKAENWWEERGYGCLWPEDNTASMLTYKLENREKIFKELGVDLDYTGPVFYKKNDIEQMT